MHTALIPKFDIPILSAKGQSNKAYDILIAGNIKGDDLALSTRKQEEMKIDILDANMGIEEEKKKVYINLSL